MTDRSDLAHDERGVIAGATRAIPFIFRIDVEPDVRLIDRFRPVPWKGFERVVKVIESIRERVAATSGSPAHFVWLLRMDPQIGETCGTAEWVAQRYSSFLKTMADRGDDIGVHPHTFRWTQQQRWVSDFSNQDWVEHCVRVSFEAYRRTFDRDCEVVAFGDRWLNAATVRLLDELGTKYDLTAEPGHPVLPRYKTEGLSTDDAPAYTDTPRRPYRPAPHDFRIDDPTRRQGMWMLPLTTARVPRDPLRRVFDALRRLPPETKGHMTLNPSLRPSWFRAIMESALQRPETQFLAMVARTEVFLDHLGDNVQTNLDWLLQHPAIGRFAFSTPARAMATLGLEADETMTGTASSARGALRVDAPLSV